MSIPRWILIDRESTSWEIIRAKIILSLFSGGVAYLYIRFFLWFIDGGHVEGKILLLTIIGWFLTSIRSWWFNRTVLRLSSSDDRHGRLIKSWGRRNYADLIPIYFINYPFLIFSIYFIVTEISPLVFKQPVTCIQKGVFALILGFSVDRLWEWYKNFPVISKRG